MPHLIPPHTCVQAVLNIGNTNTQVGWTSNSRLIRIDTIPTSTLDNLIPPIGLSYAAACVVPSARNILAKHDVLWVTPGTASQIIDFSAVDATTLGADRIANAVQLANISELPAMVFDFGTAITLEIVGEDRKFLGGAIAPGRTLMRQSLAKGTAQLPIIPLNQSEPPTFGARTADSIACGIDYGAIGMASELAAQARRRLELPANCPVWAVGGDSTFFLGKLDWLQQGGDDFTLQGILAVWKCQ